MKGTHFLNEINVVESAILKLGSTTRKSKVFTSYFNPILVALDLRKFGVRNIMVPNLQNSPEK